MASFEEAFQRVCSVFKINDLNSHQKEAIEVFINQKRDIFINLPTGYGKSLIYQALPLCFDVLNIRESKNNIVVVISPLINLMKDQVAHLQNLGISAISLSDISDEEAKAVEKGRYSLVYGTPESWLHNKRWRTMLSSNVYTSNVCAIAVDEAHVIKQWGTSNTRNMAAFRESYSELHELRSLVSNSVNIVALTATATLDTTETIMDVLLMKKPHVISELPNKPNIAYSVDYMTKDKSLEEYFYWLVEEVLLHKQKSPRTIIYCQTIRQCGLLYSTLRALLQQDMYLGQDKNPKNVVLEMLHSCTPNNNKEAILREFQSEKSGLRVLIATIAFGMGIDCKGVCRVIHFGPSKNIESYVQETGRAGRDGKQSVAFIVYKGLLLNHVDRQMKKYVSTSTCRRKTLIQNFDSCDLSQIEPMHLCCDNCAAVCQCGATNCKEYTTFPGNSKTKPNSIPVRKRVVTREQQQQLHQNLRQYHNTLLRTLILKSENNQVKSLSHPQFLLGFSEVQISQVCTKCAEMFTLQDVLSKVEIWDVKHAHKILEILNEVFEDVSEMDDECINDILNESQECFMMEEWDDIAQDESLLELALENLSISNLDSESDLEELSYVDVPASVLEILENHSYHN